MYNEKRLIKQPDYCQWWELTKFLRQNIKIILRNIIEELYSSLYSIICLFRIAVGPDEKFGLDRVRITEGFMFR